MFPKYLLRTFIPLRKSVWKCSNQITPKDRQALCTYLLSSSNSPEVTYRPQNIPFLEDDSAPEVDLHTNLMSHLYGIRQEYFSLKHSRIKIRSTIQNDILQLQDVSSKPQTPASNDPSATRGTATLQLKTSM